MFLYALMDYYYEVWIDVGTMAVYCWYGVYEPIYWYYLELNNLCTNIIGGGGCGTSSRTLHTHDQLLFQFEFERIF